MLQLTKYIVIAALMLTGCTTTKHLIAPQLTIIDQPKVGDEHSSELGETLVQKGKLYTYDGFSLENTVTAGGGIFKTLTLRSGTLLKKTMFDEDRLYYTTDKMEIYDSMLGTQAVFGGLAVNKTDDSDVIFYSGFAKDFVPEPQPILVKKIITDLEKPNFRQELIYNGRSGDTIKILYREHSGDLLRAPFSQDVQYDLKEGSTIGFKGARIEVINATNIKILYRVLNTFPDRL
jgi:hypothetical protein